MLLIDTRTHPHDAQDLLARIRKVTDKPVKWVINSHFHGDHNFGNAVFKSAGATFVAQQETARIMRKYHAEGNGAADRWVQKARPRSERGQAHPADVTFDNAMTIRLGGREVQLMYFGPGQQAGDTFVLFPHARTLFTPGAFGKRSMPNMAFTTSVENWIKLLDQVAAMDVDKILPAHGDVAERADVKELAAMLANEYVDGETGRRQGPQCRRGDKNADVPPVQGLAELPPAQRGDQGDVRADTDRQAQLFRSLRQSRPVAANSRR